jgi:uncharacterized protein
MKNKLILAIGILTYMFISCTHSQKEYYNNGVLKTESEIKDGIKNGYSKHYSANGYLIALYNYEDGMKQGEFFTYYPDGNIEKHGFFNKDKLHGILIQFSTSKDTLLKTCFINGEITYTIRYDNGKPIRKIDNINNKITIYR